VGEYSSGPRHRGSRRPRKGDLMKRLLVVAAAALAAVALYATTAPAGQQAVTPKQFAALKKQVTKLQTDLRNLTNVAGFMLACGYNRGAIAITKAPTFHETASGETTDFYALTTKDQECVTAINRPLARKLLRAYLTR
jgi:hypothetical protein